MGKKDDKKPGETGRRDRIIATLGAAGIAATTTALCLIGPPGDKLPDPNDINPREKADSPAKVIRQDHEDKKILIKAFKEVDAGFTKISSYFKQESAQFLKLEASYTKYSKTDPKKAKEIEQVLESYLNHYYNIDSPSMFKTIIDSLKSAPMRSLEEADYQPKFNRVLRIINGETLDNSKIIQDNRDALKDYDDQAFRTVIRVANSSETYPLDNSQWRRDFVATDPDSGHIDPAKRAQITQQWTKEINTLNEKMRPAMLTIKHYLPKVQKALEQEPRLR